MKMFGAVGVLALALALTCCTQSISVSGTYAYSDPSGAVELVLTENDQQQIMGSMSVAVLQNNVVRNQADSITGGAYDPMSGSLTLTIKPNSLLEPSFNATGMVVHGTIDLTLNGTMLHLTSSSQQDFNATVAALAQKGMANQHAKALATKNAEDVKSVAALTLNLNTYNTMVESSKGGPKVARAMEEKIVAAAQKDLHTLEAMQEQGQGNSYPAGQVRFNIGQLDFQMGQVKFRVDSALQEGRSAIAGFDQRLAKSPCNTSVTIQGCADLALQKQRYAKIRERIVAHEDELMADIEKYGTQMKALNHAAGN